MASLRRVTPGGVTQSLRLLDARIESSFDRESHAQIQVPQPLETLSGESITPNESDDEIYIAQDGSDIFGGVLRDVSRTGTTIELLADSFSRVARDAEPSGPSETVTDTDSAIVARAIADAPGLSEGTIETIETDLEFEFHHASPALRIKLVRQATGGEVIYHPDKSVDYVASLGTEKTATTISPSNQQLVDQIRVDENAGEVLANHLRVIGSDGSSVDVVADSYNASTDREKWRRAYFRDTSSPKTLTKRGNTLLDMIGVPWTKAESTLTAPPGGTITPALGDTYHVSVPAKDLDANLRVTTLTHRLAADGEYWDATFSNRAEDVGDDLEKLNQAARDTGATRTAAIYELDEDIRVTKDTEPVPLAPWERVVGQAVDPIVETKLQLDSPIIVKAGITITVTFDDTQSGDLEWLVGLYDGPTMGDNYIQTGTTSATSSPSTTDTGPMQLDSNGGPFNDILMDEYDDPTFLAGFFSTSAIDEYTVAAGSEIKYWVTTRY